MTYLLLLALKTNNNMIENSVFPDSLKQVDYRPVSILPNLSKIYKRCMYTQMNKYFDPIRSKY